MDQTIAQAVEKVTGYFTELGFEEHFLTDYGDEIGGRIHGAYSIARRCDALVMGNIVVKRVGESGSGKVES